jgi:hypothetical protein
MRKPKRNMVKGGIRARRLQEALKEWDRLHGYDFPLMVEEKPSLFQALIENPSFFTGSQMGEQYSRMARSIVEKAEKARPYRDFFLNPREQASPKERRSIGRIVVVNKRGRSKGK